MTDAPERIWAGRGLYVTGDAERYYPPLTEYFSRAAHDAAIKEAEARGRAEGLRLVLASILGETLIVAPASVPARTAAESIRAQCASLIRAALAQEAEG